MEFWDTELNSSLQLLAQCNFIYNNQSFGLCHNDLLSGNILIDEQKYNQISNFFVSNSNACVHLPNDTRNDSSINHMNTDCSEDSECLSISDSDMFLIDFEYADWNIIAYDIANHFCEMCGFDCDWAAFPSAEEQHLFISAYVMNRPKLEHFPNSNSSSSISTEDEISTILEYTNAMIIFPHLFWGIWALIQSKNSSIEFDYFNYSILRKQGYLKMKANSWNLLKILSK